MTKDVESKIPSWDGKSSTFGVYVNKLVFYAELVGCGDAMDKVEMRNCPTKSEYGTLDRTVADEKVKIDLYKATTKDVFHHRTGTEYQSWYGPPKQDKKS